MLNKYGIACVIVGGLVGKTLREKLFTKKEKKVTA